MIIILSLLLLIIIKVEKVHEQQAKDDFYLLSELIHDYIGIVSAVKDAFNERVKAWQSWQGVQVRLTIRYKLLRFYCSPDHHLTFQWPLP